MHHCATVGLEGLSSYVPGHLVAGMRPKTRYGQRYAQHAQMYVSN
jgi:hypothetical protein